MKGRLRGEFELFEELLNQIDITGVVEQPEELLLKQEALEQQEKAKAVGGNSVLFTVVFHQCNA